MRKVKKIIAVCLMLFVLTACSSETRKDKKEVSEDTNKTKTEKVVKKEESEEIEKKEETKKEDSKEIEESEDLKLLKAGIISPDKVGIGTPVSDVIVSKGEPVEKGYFIGGLYLAYEDIVYITNGLDDEDGYTGEVIIIGVLEGREVLGLKIGQSTEKIKAKLGEADYLGKGDSEDELYGDQWLTSYDYGGYSLTFTSKDERGKIEGIYLEKNMKNVEME